MSLTAMLVLVSLAGIFYRQLRTEETWLQDRRLCFQIQRSLEGALEMVGVDHGLDVKSLPLSADLLAFLYGCGYLDGGDHGCPPVWNWAYTRLEKGKARCLRHGSRENPLPRNDGPGAVPVPPRAPLPPELIAAATRCSIDAGKADALQAESENATGPHFRSGNEAR